MFSKRCFFSRYFSTNFVHDFTLSHKVPRAWSRSPAKSKMSLFVTKVNSCKALTIVTKNSSMVFTNEKLTLLSTLSLHCKLLDNNESFEHKHYFRAIVFFNSKNNLAILLATIDYILSIKRSDERLL